MHVVVNHYGKKYDLFDIDSTNGDGGYCVKPLISKKKHEDLRHLICKIKIPTYVHDNFGFHNVKVQDCLIKSWVVSKVPKISHHIDGSAHISEYGIVSGFNEAHEPKGAAVESFDLRKLNDGGPVFSLTAWNLEKLTQECLKAESNQVILKPHGCLTDKPLTQKMKFAVCVEGFYLPLSAKTYINSSNFIPFKHPNFGLINLKFAQIGENMPGLIALSCHITSLSAGFVDQEFGYVLSGGPGLIKKDGVENLSVSFPYNLYPNNFFGSPECLDYKM